VIVRATCVAFFAFFASLAACAEPADRPAGSDAIASAATTRADGRCEHGLTPALCPRCTPALEAVYRRAGNWCDEHGFPESICPICHPDAELPDVEDTSSPRANDDDANDDDTSDTPPSERDAEVAAIEARLVQIASEELVAAAGIVTVPAERGEVTPELSCAARIAFDADRVADVRALVPGVVRRLHVELGQHVEVGAPLFELQSVRIGEVQAELASAREQLRSVEATLERRRALHADGMLPTRELEASERERSAAEAEVRAREAMLRLGGAGGGSGRQVLRAPIAGTVVRRPAVLGALANEELSLATIADTSTMWALCELPEARAHEVVVGLPVRVSVVGRDAPIEGELTWIASEVDPRSRTVTARAVVPNADGALRAHQFARAVVQTGPARGGVRVPREAVQRVEGHEVVFVRLAPRVFEPRVVRRFGDGSSVSIEGSVEPGEPIVTTGAVLLRTEILPGSIGAGCCEVE
jgi:cobalt-zinc-cadmium efflux system membrane fusion protein